MKYRVWLITAASLFVISIIVGWSIPNDISGLLSEDIAQLAQLSNFLLSLPPIVTALLIFLKNSLSLLLSFAFSPLLCLMPLLALLFNGVLLGWVSASVIERESIGLLLAGILPHGVIELPAFIIGEAAALSFGAMVIIFPITLLFKKENRTILLSTVKQSKGHILLTLALFFTVGIYFTIIIIALFNKQTKVIVTEKLMVNFKQNLKYLTIALALLIPAAFIEAFITPLLIK